MTFRRKDNLTTEEKRERVNRVMDAWQSYPDFAHLFAALLDANGISLERFAVDYAQATGTSVSDTHMHFIRAGFRQPTYQFVADIADHALLSFDPERVRQADASVTAGEHRTALFAAAGLIEVTPDSIRHWNQEVLAGWQRRRQPESPQLALTWRELMNKLLSFHSQGGRWHYKDLAEAANAQSAPDCQLDEARTHALLSGSSSVPTRDERLALAKALGLDAAQTGRIEAAIEDGTLPLTSRPALSSFAGLVDDILVRLRAHGLSQQQIVLRTIPLGAAEPELGRGCLSKWKNGRTRPTLATLRVFVGALDRCRDAAGRPLVSPDELHQLVIAASFSLEDLTATTHDIIARIDGTTRLKPLLSALRNAADLSVAMSALDSPVAQPGISEGIGRWARRLEDWEREASATSPAEPEVRDLLARFNRLLRAKGQVELNAEEIEKIMEVVRRDREDGLQRGFLNRAREHRPPPSRRVICPDFDGSPSL